MINFVYISALFCQLGLSNNTGLSSNPPLSAPALHSRPKNTHGKTPNHSRPLFSPFVDGHSWFSCLVLALLCLLLYPPITYPNAQYPIKQPKTSLPFSGHLLLDLLGLVPMRLCISNKTATRITQPLPFSQ
jgi:hypothetical protein